MQIVNENCKFGIDTKVLLIMFSKKKNTSKLDAEQRELYDNARKRTLQKKRLFQHFIIFLIGAVFFIVLNVIIGYKENFMPLGYNWFVWAILLWVFILLGHVFNVFVTNKFLGKEWKDRQMTKLVQKQKEKIAEMQTQVEKDFPANAPQKKTTPEPESNPELKAENERFKPKTNDPENRINLTILRYMITMIAAAAENNALGKDQDLVWHLPDDFKRFKKLTTGHHIIMGRKTFETFPKPLPNRTHIVITRKDNYLKKDATVVSSLEKALEFAKNDEQPFIIGGGEIYDLGMEVADKIELTRVHGTFDADTFFPEIDEEKWELVAEEFHPKDEKHDYAFTYLTYVRK